MEIKEHDLLLELYDLYHNLLTEKQRAYFESYYFMDLSLAEVASEFNLSRNAIFDQLKKVEDKLYDFERKLSLKNKYDKIRDIVTDDNLYSSIIDCLKE